MSTGRPIKNPRASTARRSHWEGALLGLALAVGTLVGASPRATAAPAAAAPAGPEATALELALIDAVNADRAAAGVVPVAYDSSLLEIARRRAADQLPLPQLSHYDADGQPVVALLLAAAQLDYRLVGENLVRLPGPDATTVARAEAALLGSPYHRATILEPRFDTLAAGAATDEIGRVTFAQLFRATR